MRERSEVEYALKFSPMHFAGHELSLFHPFVYDSRMQGLAPSLLLTEARHRWLWLVFCAVGLRSGFMALVSICHNQEATGQTVANTNEWGVCGDHWMPATLQEAAGEDKALDGEQGGLAHAVARAHLFYSQPGIVLCHELLPAQTPATFSEHCIYSCQGSTSQFMGNDVVLENRAGSSVRERRQCPFDRRLTPRRPCR